MVTTRKSTNSLPEKRAFLVDEVFSAQKPKRRTSAKKSDDSPSTPDPGPKSRAKLARSRKTASTASTTEASTAAKPTVEAEAPAGVNTKTSRRKAATTKAKSATKAAESNDGSALLDLPAELRNEIWAYALVERPRIFVHHMQPYLKEPGLLAVNQQVRSEAMPIFWGENTLEVHGSGPATKFLRSCSDAQLRAIRTVHISGSNIVTRAYARDKIIAMLAEFKRRGLSKQAMHFQVKRGRQTVWANLQTLKQFEEYPVPEDSVNDNYFEDMVNRIITEDRGWYS